MTKYYNDNWGIFEKLLGAFRYQRVIPYILRKNKPVCVDLGCGFNGRFLRMVSPFIRRGYGFDIRGNNQKFDNVMVINNSRYGGNIPLKDESADCMFMLAVLEHLPANSQLLKEGIRTLKKGGLCILTTPTPFSKPILEFLSYKLHIISEDSIREHKHYYTEMELRSLMNEYGCSILKYNHFQLGMNQMIVGIKM